MTQLLAGFEKRFRGGARIQVQLDEPIDGFSITVLFGASGSGKTTILRCLAGLEAPEQGSIQFRGQTWFDAARGIFQPPQLRGVGYLFQQYALFPHRTVQQNIAFGVARDDSKAKHQVEQLIERFELTGLQKQYPRELSGGQQQRVALARALACRPQILLLDEPLSALDDALRYHVRSQLRLWLKECSLPTIMVTHDRADAMALGDRIVILENGRILQQGALADVFSKPANEAVAKIVGVESILPGQVAEQSAGMVRVVVGGASLWAAAQANLHDRVFVCVRGEDVILSRSAGDSSSIRNRLQGTIVDITLEGALARVTVDCGFRLAATITRPACEELGLHGGDHVHALIKASAIHVLPH